MYQVGEMISDLNGTYMGLVTAIDNNLGWITYIASCTTVNVTVSFSAAAQMFMPSKYIGAQQTATTVHSRTLFKVGDKVKFKGQSGWSVTGIVHGKYEIEIPFAYTLRGIDEIDLEHELPATSAPGTQQTFGIWGGLTGLTVSPITPVSPQLEEPIQQPLPKCECGSDAVGSPKHADYCPKYNKES